MNIDEILEAIEGKKDKKISFHSPTTTPAMLTSCMEEFNKRPVLAVGDFVRAKKGFSRYKTKYGIVCEIIEHPKRALDDNETQKYCEFEDIVIGIINASGEFSQYTVDSRYFVKWDLDPYSTDRIA